MEFGTGGSTFVASRHVAQSIISVDSSVEWIDKVRSACSGGIVEPTLLHIDIGPTGDWGFPIDHSTQSKWARYHEAVWDLEESKEADLYMIDGRFRVACFAQAVKHGDSKCIIGFHDFGSRKQYHCVYEIAKEIATVEDMSFFQPLNGAMEIAAKLIDEYKWRPD
jgi:hypothetical protein